MVFEVHPPLIIHASHKRLSLLSFYELVAKVGGINKLCNKKKINPTLENLQEL